MPRPKQRTPALRAAVLEHALALLAEGGPVGFTARAVAERAGTSTAAIYELFGDKNGVVRELFFEGFRRMDVRLGKLETTGDARVDLCAIANAFRAFAVEHRWLSEVMFARPIQSFSPAPEDFAVVSKGYRTLMTRVNAAVCAGVIAGEPKDLALVLMSTTEGLIAMEASGRLGRRVQDRDRRFKLALDALLAGLAPRGG